jgi:hypothetical protein
VTTTDDSACDLRSRDPRLLSVVRARYPRVDGPGTRKYLRTPGPVHLPPDPSGSNPQPLLHPHAPQHALLTGLSLLQQPFDARVQTHQFALLVCDLVVQSTDVSLYGRHGLHRTISHRIRPHLQRLLSLAVFVRLFRLTKVHAELLQGLRIKRSGGTRHTGSQYIFLLQDCMVPNAARAPAKTQNIERAFGAWNLGAASNQGTHSRPIKFIDYGLNSAWVRGKPEEHVHKEVIRRIRAVVLLTLVVRFCKGTEAANEALKMLQVLRKFDGLKTITAGRELLNEDKFASMPILPAVQTRQLVARMEMPSEIDKLAVAFPDCMSQVVQMYSEYLGYPPLPRPNTSQQNKQMSNYIADVTIQNLPAGDIDFTNMPGNNARQTLVVVDKKNEHGVNHTFYAGFGFRRFIPVVAAWLWAHKSPTSKLPALNHWDEMGEILVREIQKHHPPAPQNQSNRETMWRWVARALQVRLIIFVKPANGEPLRQMVVSNNKYPPKNIIVLYHEPTKGYTPVLHNGQFTIKNENWASFIDAPNNKIGGNAITGFMSNRVIKPLQTTNQGTGSPPPMFPGINAHSVMVHNEGATPQRAPNVPSQQPNPQFLNTMVGLTNQIVADPVEAWKSQEVRKFLASLTKIPNDWEHSEDLAQRLGSEKFKKLATSVARMQVHLDAKNAVNRTTQQLPATLPQTVQNFLNDLTKANENTRRQELNMLELTDAIVARQIRVLAAVKEMLQKTNINKPRSQETKFSNDMMTVYTHLDPRSNQGPKTFAELRDRVAGLGLANRNAQAQLLKMFGGQFSLGLKAGFHHANNAANRTTFYNNAKLQNRLGRHVVINKNENRYSVATLRGAVDSTRKLMFDFVRKAVFRVPAPATRNNGTLKNNAVYCKTSDADFMFMRLSQQQVGCLKRLNTGATGFVGTIGIESPKESSTTNESVDLDLYRDRVSSLGSYLGGYSSSSYKTKIPTPHTQISTSKTGKAAGGTPLDLPVHVDVVPGRAKSSLLLAHRFSRRAACGAYEPIHMPNFLMMYGAIWCRKKKVYYVLTERFHGTAAQLKNTTDSAVMVSCLTQALLALATMHAQGWLHGSIKAKNVTFFRIEANKGNRFWSYAVGDKKVHVRKDGMLVALRGMGRSSRIRPKGPQPHCEVLTLLNLFSELGPSYRKSMRGYHDVFFPTLKRIAAKDRPDAATFLQHDEVRRLLEEYSAEYYVKTSDALELARYNSMKTRGLIVVANPGHSYRGRGMCAPDADNNIFAGIRRMFG